MTPVANARMYAVTPAAEEAWRRLFAEIGDRAGVSLAYEAYPAPQPLERLWARADLGLVFICGFPFARSWRDLVPVAAPIPAAPRFRGRPVYATDLIVRADGPATRLEDTFGGAIGWTVGHSQSGFNAVRHHLRTHFPDRPDLFGRHVGPLVTARESVRAVLDGRVDLGPLDAYWHELLRIHEPETADRLRVVATTVRTPIPLLAASPATPPGTIRALRDALLGLAEDPAAAPRLAPLGLAGFAAVERADYGVLDEMARAAEAAGDPFATRPIPGLPASPG